MEASQTIISYAILKVNWDELRKDYLENFVPFLLECLRLSDSDIVSDQALKQQFHDHFGLDLPLNAIKLLLRRAKKNGFVYQQDNVIMRENNKLMGLNFKEKRQRLLETTEYIINDLLDFVKKYFNTSWDKEFAEKALLSYIKHNQLHLLKSSLECVPFSQEEKIGKGVKYIISSYIKYIDICNPVCIEYLDTIIKGTIIAGSIYFLEPNEKIKFKNTEVYLDTKFIMNALGYSGDSYKEPCIELLSLLYEYGADLRCFKHTYDELHGILDALYHASDRNKLASGHGPSIDYFISEGFKPSDILMFIEKLETDLRYLNIHVVKAPKYDVHEHVIDENKLDEMLADTIKKDGARERDVSSISAIIRLRKGHFTTTIENCRAIFVTKNYDLAMKSYKLYYEDGKDESKSSTPPCITDHYLFARLWLKNPFKKPDLPMKRIIADCLAATEPDEKLFAKYLFTIKKLLDQNKVTKDEYYYLRCTTTARKELMDITLGDDNSLTDGTVDDILERYRKYLDDKIKRQYLSEISSRDEYINTLENRIQSIDKVQKKSHRKKEIIIQNIASKITNSIKWFVVLCLIAGTYYAFPKDLPGIRYHFSKYLFFLPMLLLSILSLFHIIYGITVKIMIRNIEINIKEYLKNIF